MTKAITLGEYDRTSPLLAIGSVATYLHAILDSIHAHTQEGAGSYAINDVDALIALGWELCDRIEACCNLAIHRFDEAQERVRALQAQAGTAQNATGGTPTDEKRG